MPHAIDPRRQHADAVLQCASGPPIGTPPARATPPASPNTSGACSTAASICPAASTKRCSSPRHTPKPISTRRCTRRREVFRVAVGMRSAAPLAAMHGAAQRRRYDTLRQLHVGQLFRVAKELHERRIDAAECPERSGAAYCVGPSSWRMKMPATCCGKAAGHRAIDLRIVLAGVADQQEPPLRKGLEQRANHARPCRCGGASACAAASDRAGGTTAGGTSRRESPRRPGARPGARRAARGWTRRNETPRPLPAHSRNSAAMPGIVSNGRRNVLASSVRLQATCECLSVSSMSEMIDRPRRRQQIGLPGRAMAADPSPQTSSGNSVLGPTAASASGQLAATGISHRRLEVAVAAALLRQHVDLLADPHGDPPSAADRAPRIARSAAETARWQSPRRWPASPAASSFSSIRLPRPSSAGGRDIAVHVDDPMLAVARQVAQRRKQHDPVLAGEVGQRPGPASSGASSWTKGWQACVIRGTSFRPIRPRFVNLAASGFANSSQRNQLQKVPKKSRPTFVLTGH